MKDEVPQGSLLETFDLQIKTNSKLASQPDVFSSGLIYKTEGQLFHCIEKETMGMQAILRPIYSGYS